MKEFHNTFLWLPLSLGTFLVSGCTWNSFVSEKASPGEKQCPNVLFFLVDDLRPALGCYGDSLAHTPNIDRLAGEGVVFQKAYCQQAVCNPSRASLLTGLRPDENGVTDLKTHFREKVPDVVTLPQLFKNNGYYTVGTGKVFHALAQTVDPVSWTEPVPNYDKWEYLLPENQTGKGKQNVTEFTEVHDTAYNDGKIAADAIRFLENARNKGKAFFLAVGFMKPHAPFVAPKKYWDIFNDTEFYVADRERVKGSPELAYHKWQEIRGYRDVPDTGPIPFEKEQEIIRGYYACVSYIDAQIGKVMQRLEDLGLKENTIIVLWGDHGYHLGEQASWCKSTNFELDVRVPLIISARGMKGNGHSCKAIVETLDIYPTLAELCKLEPESSLSGTSLQPLLMNPDQKWKNVAFSQFMRPYRTLFSSKDPSHMGYALRTPGWRTTWWFDLKTGEVVEKELYRLSENSLEKENLSGRADVEEIEEELGGMILDYKNGEYNE